MSSLGGAPLVSIRVTCVKASGFGRDAGPVCPKIAINIRLRVITMDAILLIISPNYLRSIMFAFLINLRLRPNVRVDAAARIKTPFAALS